jgi:NAD(P)-dependent dehydrogenase (short-subunit alcohol dehydrogenase family)
MGKLDGRVAIVTGSGQGIGRGIALALAMEGAAVVVADLNADTARDAAREIEGRGAQALAVHCDITRAADIDACIKATLERFGALHILVNNAQAARVNVPLEEVTDEDFDLAINTGPKATFRFMRAAFPHLKGHGRIINVRSGSELNGLPGFGAYVAAKGAIGTMSRVAAREWGKHGITVNSIMPFAVAPNMLAHFAANPDQERRALNNIAIRRFGDPEADIGRAAVYLADPAATYVTGTTLSVDGGGSML